VPSRRQRSPPSATGTCPCDRGPSPGCDRSRAGSSDRALGQALGEPDGDHRDQHQQDRDHVDHRGLVGAGQVGEEPDGQGLDAGPASRAERRAGKVTRRKVWTPSAPRSMDASSRERETRTLQRCRRASVSRSRSRWCCWPPGPWTAKATTSDQAAIVRASTGALAGQPQCRQLPTCRPVYASDPASSFPARVGWGTRSLCWLFRW
jgi:hypothetical protein